MMSAGIAPQCVRAMWKHPIHRVRAIGFAEAVSFLLLLGVAMPLKYVAGMPLAVRVVGMAHGVLFIALGIAALVAKEDHGWGTRQLAVVMVASLVPFGPFMIDRRLRALAEQPSTDG